MSLQLLERGGDVVNMQRNVMKTFATLCDESSDDRIHAGRLKQLDSAFANRNHGCVNLLTNDRFFVLNSHSERFVEFPRRVDAFYRDTEMINPVHSFLLSAASPRIL
jgi:hypothetical protein